MKAGDYLLDLHPIDGLIHHGVFRLVGRDGGRYWKVRYLPPSVFATGEILQIVTALNSIPLTRAQARLITSKVRAK